MISTLLASSLLAAPQNPPPVEGFFADVPITVTGISTASLDSKELWVGNNGVSPLELLRVYDDRFGRVTMLGNSTAASAIRFGSFSRGRAYITAQWKSGKGVAELGTNAWCFQLFSTTMTTRGKTGSIYRQFTAAQVGGTLFSYILPGSSSLVVPPEFVGRVQAARHATEMKVLDLHGVDSYVHSHILNVPNPGPLQFFFTVNSATYSLIPNDWLRVSSERHPATIFRTTYTQGGGWSLPQPYLTCTQLGLPVNKPGTTIPTEIDALTVDQHNPTDIRVLVSTTDADLNKQLWLYWPFYSYTGPYYNSNAVDLYVKKNLGFDDPNYDGIDGMCVDDPEIIENNAMDDRHEWRNRLTAFPEPTPGANLNLHWSGHRERATDDLVDRYRINLRGHASKSNPQDSVAILWMMGPDGPTIVAAFARNNADPVDRISHLITVPTDDGGASYPIQMAWTVSHTGGIAFTHGFHFWK